MAYNTVPIARNNLNEPLPQYYNHVTDAYEVILGHNGANRVELYGPDGNPISTTSGKLNVRASEIEALAGALADAAVTDPAASASIIALLKGLLKQLQGNGPVKDQVDVVDRAARALGKITADDAAITALGALAAAAVTDPAASASVIALLKGLLKQLQGAGTGAAPVQLTGSTVQDSQAVPMTQAQKDIAMRAYENIINIIGIENIKLLLPMWETSGIEFTDLIRPYLKFKAEGVTLAQPGLLHPMPYFDGINDYVRQKPVTEATITNAWLSLNNSSYKIAQKLPQYALSGDIKFVMLHLQKVGDPNASIVVKLVADNSGQPTGAVLATTEPLSTSEMSTTARRQGLYFATAATALRNTVYWLVVEFSSVTTIDANNYIAVGYDSAGAYGQPIATYDGSIWTMVNGQSLRFEIYDDLLTLNQSYSYIVASALNGVDCRVISLPIGNIRYQSGGLSQGDYSTKNNIIVYPAGGGIRWTPMSRHEMRNF